jgi:hypothetical protein
LAKRALDEVSEPVKATPSHPMNAAKNGKRTPLAAISEQGPVKGRAQIRPFVAEHLAEEVGVDLTKKQVARDRVAWTVRVLTDDEHATRVEGVAEAEFRGREIKALRLGAGMRPG